MKIIDEITNELIEDKIAVKIDFHCFDLERYCLTVEGKSEPNNFQKKTLFVSKSTASNLIDNIKLKSTIKEEDLDQVLIQFSPTEIKKGFKV